MHKNTLRLIKESLTASLLALQIQNDATKHPSVLQFNKVQEEVTKRDIFQTLTSLDNGTKVEM